MCGGDDHVLGCEENRQADRSPGTILLKYAINAACLPSCCRETRYFATWKRRRCTEEHTLPAEVQQLSGQARCPFGDAGTCTESLPASSTSTQLGLLFTSARSHTHLTFPCPACTACTVTPYRHVPPAALCFCDTVLAAETCEELFTPEAPHIGLGLAGVEVISNGSGSHHQLRKLNQVRGTG